MKSALSLLFILSISFQVVFCQISKSYYFDNTSSPFTTSYIEKHPTESAYFTAGVRIDQNSEPYTVISKIDENGNSIWHQDISHPGFFGSVSGLCDIKVTDSYIYTLSYAFTGSPNQTLFLFKTDFNGLIVDSLIINDINGIDRVKTQMSLDGNGNLHFSYLDWNDALYACVVDPSTMNLNYTTLIGDSPYNHSKDYRSLFNEPLGANVLHAFSITDSIKFVEVNSSGAIVNSYQVYASGSYIGGLEISSGSVYAVLNTNFNATSPSDNPIRVLEITSGSITNDNSYMVQHNLVYTGLFIDDNSGEIYISSRCPYYITYKGGALIKISSGSIESENFFNNSNFGEVLLEGNSVIACGLELDEFKECQTEHEFGYNFIRYEKTSAPLTDVVSPRMSLHVNKINTIIASGGNNFQKVGNSAGYEIEGIGGHTIYNSEFLISAKDDMGNIVAPAHTYTNTFAPGPITNFDDYTLVERDKWNRVWIITKELIDQHINAFQLGDSSYNTPEVILNWPAHGDPLKGQVNNLARFKDINSNGTYEPLEGEYPLIKGDYCALSIYNDQNIDTAENCVLYDDRMGLQVSEYVYGFDCSQDSSLQNTLYLYYEVQNASNLTYDSTKVGNFVDFDILAVFDDYVGSDTERGLCFGKEGLGTGPEQGFVILGSKMDNDNLDNTFGIGNGESINGIGFDDGVVDNERYGMTNFMYHNIGAGNTGDPTTSADFYNYMNSIWRDGTPLYFGGNGYSTPTIPARYFFTEDSDSTYFYSTYGIDPGYEWSESGEGNPEGDRRGIASSGPFTFAPGDTIFYDIMYVTGVGSASGGYTSHEALEFNTDSARSYYLNNQTPCGQDYGFYEPFDGPYTADVEELKNIQQDVTVYPNPSNGIFYLLANDKISEIQVFAITGEQLKQVNGNTTTINLSDLPDGIYILNIQLEEKVIRAKVIKK